MEHVRLYKILFSLRDSSIIQVTLLLSVGVYGAKEMSCSDLEKVDSTTESYQDELIEELMDDDMGDLTLEDEAFEEENVVILGVCAMNKKVFYSVYINVFK